VKKKKRTNNSLLINYSRDSVRVKKKILSPEISRDGEPFFFFFVLLTRRLKLFYSQESVTTSKLNNSYIIWRNKSSSIAIATIYWWEKCFERFKGFDEIHVEQN